MKINQKQGAKAGMVAIALALIRCIGEVFRLQYILKDALTIEIVKPFIIGAMVCAISCLFMLILFFYSRFKWIIVLAILTIGILFFLKCYYHL